MEYHNAPPKCERCKCIDHWKCVQKNTSKKALIIEKGSVIEEIFVNKQEKTKEVRGDQ